MPGGKNKIQEHPKANTNGFKERPNRAGRPRGRRDNVSIFSDILKAEGLEILDPKIYLLNSLFKITTQGQGYARLRALLELWDRIYGKPKPSTPEDEPTFKPPLILTQAELEYVQKLGIDIDQRGNIIVEDQRQKEQMEALKNR